MTARHKVYHESQYQDVRQDNIKDITLLVRLLKIPQLIASKTTIAKMHGGENKIAKQKYKPQTNAINGK